MRFVRIFTIGLGLLFLATTVTTRKALAYPFYIDSQLGMSQFRGTDGLFGTGDSTASSYGVGANLGFFYSPFDAASGFDFQIGLQGQFSLATQGTKNYGLLAPYGVIRLQFLSAYFSAGFTPLIWRRTDTSSGVDNFALATSTMSYLTEVGYLYSATPKFSLGGAVSAQWFISSRGFGSQPLTALTFVMRFYFSLFSHGDGSGAGGTPLEYNGWRYIGK
jgi:hypothetical protein